MGELFLLTGPPRSGKTTLVTEVARRLREEGVRIGGMTTSEVSRGGTRVGFEVADISTGRTGILARVGGGAGPRIGKYVVNSAGLEDVGVSAIRHAIERADIIVIDEVGPMELTSQAFVRAVEDALSSGKPLMLTLHWRATHPLLNRIRREGSQNSFTVDVSNRTQLASEVEKRVRNAVLKGRENR